MQANIFLIESDQYTVVVCNFYQMVYFIQLPTGILATVGNVLHIADCHFATVINYLP